MSQPFPGFTGASYQTDNRYAAIERTVNWYNTPNESSDESKFKISLDPCPGNAAFSPLPVPAPFNQKARGLIELRGQVFGVNGNVCFELKSDGTYSQVGNVANDGLPVCMVANGNGQIFISSGGLGYVIPPGGLPNSLLTVNSTGFLGAAYATFQDGYILVVNPNSNVMQVGGSDDVPVGDATQWSAANVSVQAGQQDYLRAIISSHEYVVLFGHRRSQIYENVGNNGIGGFPFQSLNETFIETGCAAAFSVADLGDSLMWIGEDARGQRACWRMPAFQPQRSSNFAVERFWQEYAKVDDAVAFSFIWKGHTFYQITFPSAVLVDPPTGFPKGANPTYHSATWLYDATASQLIGRPVWTERSYQTALGYSEGRAERFHCFAFGRHLVSSTGIDGNPGAVYQYSDTGAGFSDCGVDIAGAQTSRPIIRDRICPHIWANNKRIIYNRIEFELARGVGLDGAPPVGTDPQIMLRFSRDGGSTFGAEQQVSAGMIGRYGKRVYFNRCGAARDMVFWVRCSDPVYWSVLSAMLDLFETSN